MLHRHLNLSSERLRELEAVADDATRLRRQVQKDSGARRFNVSTAVAVMIRGRVSAVPNLRHRDRRVSGLFMPGGAFPHIGFEAHEPPRRQRFTVAHELGHSYLDPLQETLCDPDVMEADSITEERDVSESEADAFAAAF